MGVERHAGPTLLKSAVGAGAVNLRTDVRSVQHIFNRSGLTKHLDEDGIAGPQTIKQIRAYQFHHLHFRQPDGRVDPDGRTLRSLLQRLAVRRTAPRSTAAPHPRVERAVVAALPTAIRAATTTQRLAAPGAGGDKLTEQDFVNAAARLGPSIEPALVHAIADAESGGKSGFGASGLPIIAFEGHIFRKYTKRAYDQTHPMLSYPYRQKAGPEWRHNNANQTKAWETLSEASALDHEAGLLACSWGMFQVMGFNFASCGYPDVDAFVDAMKAGERGQLEACIGYCKSRPGMIAAMQRKDFVAIATAYNGADYGDYDQRIRRAYLKHKG